MKRILVTAVGSDVSDGIVRCILSEMKDVLLFGCDIKPFVPNLNHLKKYFHIPQYDTDAYWPIIQSVCIEYQITYFIPTSEPEIIFMDRHRDFFTENNIYLIINNSRIINIVTSKYRTAKFLRRNNVFAPDTFLPEFLPPKIQYPLVVKPDFGRGSKNIAIVNNEESLKKALVTIPSPIIQEYIGSDEQEYTVGVFSNGSDICSIAFKRKLGYGGMSVFVETIVDTELESIALKCAKLFELVGYINIQLRLKNGKFHIFEINPRISSTVCFRHKLGFKDVIWWLRIINGEKYNYQKKIISGIIGLKVFNEQIFYPPFEMKMELPPPPPQSSIEH
jgi:carbamoyl-phosphate synthase large subunit